MYKRAAISNSVFEKCTLSKKLNSQQLITFAKQTMKKAVIIFLLFIYAFTSTGFAVKGDYCCNNLTSVKLVLADGAKDKEGCCKVKYGSFKVKDAHDAAVIIYAPTLSYSYLHTLNSIFQVNGVNEQSNSRFINIHAPPIISSIPVYLSNCVFRI